MRLRIRGEISALEDARQRVGEVFRDEAGPERAGAGAVQPYRRARRLESRRTLREEAADEAGERVAGAGGGERRWQIAADARPSVRRGDDGVRPLDEHDSPERARFVLVEPNRNLLLGVAILIGFMTFVAMDKGLRIATGGEGHEHSHGGHSHGEDESAAASGSSSAVDTPKSKEAKSRKKNGTAGKAGKKDKVEDKEINPSVKLGGYLNLM